MGRTDGEMKVVSFLDPPLREVIEKILRGHRRAALVDGLWKASAPRGPPDPIDMDHDTDSEFIDPAPELTFIDMDTFLSTF